MKTLFSKSTETHVPSLYKFCAAQVPSLNKHSAIHSSRSLSSCPISAGCPRGVSLSGAGVKFTDPVGSR